MSTTSERKWVRYSSRNSNQYSNWGWRGSEFEYSSELAIQFNQRDELNNELEIQVTFRLEYEYEECGEYIFSKFKGSIYSEFCIQNDK